MKKNLINRVSGLLVYEVAGANPNGNPDGGMPRTTPTGHGWVTGISIKRKMREIMDDHESPIFKSLQAEMKFDPKRMFVFESRTRGLSDDPVESMNKMLEMDGDEILNRFWDARINGVMLLEKNDKKSKGETGKSKRLTQTGPFSIGEGLSVAPVSITEATITRKAPLDEELLKKGAGGMGPMALKFVNHGVYCHRFGINPQEVERSRVQLEDIGVLRALFRQLFTSSTSVARPYGSINLLRVFWGEHENVLGSFKDSDFYKALTPVRKGDANVPSESLDDYEIPDHTAFKGAKMEDLS